MIEQSVSKRLRFEHVALSASDLGIFDVRSEDGTPCIDMVFFPETCGWNPISDTPTLWQVDGTVTIPWRKTPKSMRRLFAGLGQSPKAVTVKPHGYAAPPEGEPIYIGRRHVVRGYPVLAEGDSVKRFIARMVRKLRRNRGTVTVFSRDLSKARPPDARYMIGMTYSSGDNPFGGASLPEAWLPFGARTSRDVATQPAEPESSSEPT